MTLNRRDFLGSAGAVAALAFHDGNQRAREQSPFSTADFPIFQARPGVTYLDSAATTMRPRAVIDALVAFYSSDNANPSPVHAVAAQAASRLDLARRTVARFINAADPLEVIFTRGSTEGINLIAETFGSQHLREGDEVVLSVAEHNSNLLPWTRAAQRARATIRIADVDDEGRLTPAALRAVCSSRTRLVALSHVSNVLGFVNPVHELTAAAKTFGAAVVIDGAQGAPHVAIDVQAIGCDYYVFSGHKMLGPMATGVVWGRRALLDSAPPYHVGSNMAHEVTFESAQFEHGALKYQAGTPDVAGPVGLAAAIGWFERAGRDALTSHDADLVGHGLERLRGMRGVRLIGPSRPENRVPVFTFVAGSGRATAVAMALDKKGIAVRAGDMAALPLLKRFGASEAVRASAYVYSRPADFDRLADALREML